MAGGFFGSLVLTASAAWANRHEPAFAWILVALALSLVAVVITMAVNVPLNDALKGAGDPDRITDLGRVRDAFHEGRWAAWNLVRTLVSLAALGCLAWALVLHGRATG